jgi:hypothetical protein
MHSNQEWTNTATKMLNETTRKVALKCLQNAIEREKLNKNSHEKLTTLFQVDIALAIQNLC